MKKDYRVTLKTAIGISSAMKGQKLSKRRVHVVAREGKWAVKREGAQRAHRICSNKEDAINAGKVLLRKGQAHNLIIHGKDGRVMSTAKASSQAKKIPSARRSPTRY